MRYRLCFIVPAVAGWLLPSMVLANCPSGLPNEIFCEDFDTYCAGGGFPGDAHCPTSGSSADSNLLRQVWSREPFDSTGVQLIVETTQKSLTSAPFGGRYPCQQTAQNAPQVIRDWVHSPAVGQPGQISNLSWKIEALYGVNKTAVAGTDDLPLVLQFMMDGGSAGKIDWDNGYVAVTLDDGDPLDKLDAANTDYADGPDCNTYCNPPLQFLPMPIVCAQGNPLGPLPAACPNAFTNPPPIRQAIAVGTLGIMDNDPCHCGVVAHGPANNHLSLFDGQKWWMLRENNPVATTGSITPREAGAPFPITDYLAAGISEPGKFDLNGGTSRAPGKGTHWVTLTLKTTTLVVEMTTQETSTFLIPGDTKYYQYYISSSATLPRAYLGAFNSLRIGVDEGCQIQGDNGDLWACGASDTHPLVSGAPSAGTVVFDDLYFHGGTPLGEEGACCHADATCTNVLPDQCDGVFRGRSTTCESLTQPCCPQAYGDTNADGDVDMGDFAVLQRCLTIGGGAIDPACKCLNRNGDAAIDAVDVDGFIQCANGPQVPGEIAPPCLGVGW